MAISTLLPSKNRPSQTQTFLQSCLDNAKGIFEFLIVYKATTPEFAQGYEKLKDWAYANFGENCQFVEEDCIKPRSFYKTDFKSIFERFLLDCGTDPFMLVTDDSLIYRTLPENAEEIIRADLEREDVFAFSTRLGRNTIVQTYWTHQIVPLPQILYTTDHTRMWDFKHHSSYGNFSVVPACDGVIYRATDILALINRIEFTNLRGFEGILSSPAKRDWIERPLMSSFHESVLVNISINSVVDCDEVPNGLFHSASPEEINAKYLDGYSLEFDIDPEEVDACHGEFEPIFTKPHPIVHAIDARWDIVDKAMRVLEEGFKPSGINLFKEIM